MNKLECWIKKTRAPIPPLPQNFSKQVLEQIQRENLKIARRHGMSASFILLLSALGLSGSAVILLNLLLFELKTNGAVELLYFGTDFFKASLALIPMDIVFVTAVVLLLSSWAFKKSKIAKIGVAGITSISFILTGFGGAAMAVSNFNETLQQQISDIGYEVPFLSRFYKERALYRVHLPNFRFGKVTAVHPTSIQVENPRGKVFSVRLSGEDTFQVGQIIRLKGVLKDQFFHLHRFQHCDGKRAGRYFGQHRRGRGLRRHMMKKMRGIPMRGRGPENMEGPRHINDMGTPRYLLREKGENRAHMRGKRHHKMKRDL